MYYLAQTVLDTTVSDTLSVSWERRGITNSIVIALGSLSRYIDSATMIYGPEDCI